MLLLRRAPALPELLAVRPLLRRRAMTTMQPMSLLLKPLLRPKFRCAGDCRASKVENPGPRKVSLLPG